MSTPLVAVVGRPNVGKSTLFNRFAGRRIAIVEDTPGITRDRLYTTAEWAGHTFTVIDTGGIVLDTDDPLTLQVRQQAEIAMEEADAILFLCDASAGVTPADRDLADALRASRVPVLLAVNKADNSRVVQESVEFYELGYPRVYSVSAAHGLGVADLLDALVEALPSAEPEEIDEDVVRLAVIGRPNVGKSSFINAVLGEDRVIVSPIPGTTRDAIDTRIAWDGSGVVLVDTAGIRRAGKIQGSVEYYTVLRARTAIDRCTVCVVVIDGFDGLTEGDKRVAGIAHEMGRAVVIAVNKWDLMDQNIVERRSPDPLMMRDFSEGLRNDMPFLAYAPIAFCAAKQRFAVGAVVDTALMAAGNHAFRIPTGELNRLVRNALEARPRMYRGKQLKVYYSTMARTQPPTIVLFVNDPELMHFSYMRYLENQIRKTYPLSGTPLVIRVRKAENTEREQD